MSPDELRPSTLSEFVGQSDAIPNLLVYIQSAKARKAALDHVLLFGPPGVGKTSLARIIANELEAGYHEAMAPALKQLGDLIRILGGLKPRDVLFLDEIHRLSPAINEILYPVMEDFKAEFQYGSGRTKRSMKASIPPFTIVGATTRAGILPQPLRDRFGIQVKLNLYSVPDLTLMLVKAGQKASINMGRQAAEEIAKRSRGTPRNALTLLRRVQDFCVVEKGGTITGMNVVDRALSRMGIDDDGLNAEDHRYLKCLADCFGGGPAGVEAIAAAMGEDRDTIEDAIEPYLLQAGFVQRSSRGRMLSPLILAKYLPGLTFEEEGNGN